MQQFLFVLHLPIHAVGYGPGKELPKMIDWAEFEPQVMSTGLPTEVLSKPLGGSQRLARNLWLIQSEESARSLAAIQRIAGEFEIGFSAFVVPCEITSMGN